MVLVDNLNEVHHNVCVPGLCVPDFVQVEHDLISQDVKNKAEVNDVWMTEDLAREVQSFCPAQSDIVDKKKGLRDASKFSEQCTKSFYLGRQFASKWQLQQKL